MATKTIVPNQRFRHDGVTYEAGESYEVSPELAFYFEMSGWVGERQSMPTEPVVLEVHDGEHGQTSEVK